MIPDHTERISEAALKKRILKTLHPDPGDKLVIEVRAVLVEAECPITVYEVEVIDGKGSGSWLETFATFDLLKAFLRGVQMTFAMSKLQRLCPDFESMDRWGERVPEGVQFTQRSFIDRLDGTKSLF